MITAKEIEEVYNKEREEDEQYYTFNNIPKDEVKKIINQLIKSKDGTNKKRT